MVPKPCVRWLAWARFESDFHIDLQIMLTAESEREAVLC